MKRILLTLELWSIFWFSTFSHTSALPVDDDNPSNPLFDPSLQTDPVQNNHVDSPVSLIGERSRRDFGVFVSNFFE